MGTESSDEQPKIRKDATGRRLRGWEDKAFGLLGAAVVALVCWMWSGLSAQITRLEEARIIGDTRLAVQHEEISALKRALNRIEDKLDEALRKKP